MSATILWFRRDLRLHDHPALAAALADGGPVAPLFVMDERLLSGRWRSPNRLWFLRGSVLALADALAARGAPLTVLRGDPAVVVPAWAAALGARRVLVSRDYGPYGRARDAAVADRLAEAGIAWSALPGQLIAEPGAVLTAAGGSFRVFGPFQRAWAAADRRPVLAAPDRIPGLPRGAADRTAAGGLLAPVVPTADEDLLPPAGELAARERLRRWAGSPALDRYASDRDRLDLDGTSRLGADLRFGLLSPIEVAERCAGPGDGRRRFLAELAWRDFYAHLLWHEPRIARESFRRELEPIAWERDPALIDAWRLGRTGYPVVDAAMRQLAATGWMHNRARMIVASFLTKDLGVDWRIGERHFMEHLVDGDPASNNGGWQWAASTGTDPQPWFRVFNPTLQGLRQDPDGVYVRRWVPELAGLAGATAHLPPPNAYLSPIVDHVAARNRALDAYRTATARA
jgi:deoxyribodipyrimidine photo-lyase